MKAILALGLAACCSPPAASTGRPWSASPSFLPLRATAAAPATGPSVKAGRRRGGAALRRAGFCHRRKGQRFESDFYNEFAAAPAELLGQATATWLRCSGLLPPSSSPAPSRRCRPPDRYGGFRLYVDFTDEGPAAVLAVRWRITGRSRATREVSRDGGCRSRPERHGAARRSRKPWPGRRPA